MNLFKRFLFELQEMSYLIYRVLLGIVKGPRYYSEIIRQMDNIGVGSLVIIILTGFFYRRRFDPAGLSDARLLRSAVGSRPRCGDDFDP